MCLCRRRGRPPQNAGEGRVITPIPSLPPACHVQNLASAATARRRHYLLGRWFGGSVGYSEQLILDRAAPTLVRTLENGQGTGVLKETSTIAVASMAKMFVGDIVEEGKKNCRVMYNVMNCYYVEVRSCWLLTLPAGRLLFAGCVIACDYYYYCYYYYYYCYYYYYSSSCLLYTSPSPRDRQKSRMPSSA